MGCADLVSQQWLQVQVIHSARVGPGPRRETAYLVEAEAIVLCRDFNLVFKFPKEAFRFPDGSMVGHPMLSMVSGQLEAAGISNPLEKLMKETEAVFTEQGFVRDHSFVFPRNVAVIATAIA